MASGHSLSRPKHRYALIGGAVAHSLSPQLHSLLGHYTYDLIEVSDAAQLPELLADTRYDGFNVTIPYKQAVLPLMDELSEEARSVGAVNTIRRQADGTLRGYNTDVYGFRRLFAPGSVSGRKVLVLGTGGASRAVRTALHTLAAGTVISVSRDPAAAASADPALQGSVISYAELPAHSDAAILVNTTPVGMYPHGGRSPLDGYIGLTDFPQLEAVVDLIYNPHRTKLLQEAEAAGVDTISGLAMLIWQGIGARDIWVRRHGRREQRLAAAAMKQLLGGQLNLVTVGMPGSGKSCLSRRIAGQMKRDFVDIDQQIAEQEGRTAEEIIEQDGEAAFRDIEARALAEVLQEPGRVIATGGGAVLREDNRERIRENSIVLYIDRPCALLATENRPLSDGRGVEQLYAERAALYRAVADEHLDNHQQWSARHSYSRGMHHLAHQALALYRHQLGSRIHHDLRGVGEGKA